MLNKKKSIFCIFKEKVKDKIVIIKDNNKDKDKEKKMKNKKTKRKKHKEEKSKTNKKDSNQSNKKSHRKDKSFTMVSNINQTLNNDEYNNNKSLHSSKTTLIDDKKNEEKPKINPNNNNNSPQNEIKTSTLRRNSTRDLFRENKEKITAYTNKQTIENINEYTRQCLEIIPELFELGDKMPRIKTKINPNFSKNKKIALFDLDETIVHCLGEINMNNIESLSRQSDAKIKVQLPGRKKEVTIGINIRPHWEEALTRIKDKYHIVAFTASHESYADSVLNYLDPNNEYFEHRLYRAHCVLCSVDGAKFYVKDLKILEDNYNLKDVVIIDNSVLSFAYHLDNGIPISPYYDSKVDTELLEIADFLVKYADENDIRDKLKEVYKLNQYFEILKDYSSEQSSDISIIEEEKNNDKSSNNCPIIKNETNKNLKYPLIINDMKIGDNEEKKETNHEHTSKIIPKINLEMKNLFLNNEKKDGGEEEYKNITPNLSGQKIITHYLTKNVDEKSKSREKQKTLKVDINFLKEWEEKQKELKNK